MIDFKLFGGQMDGQMDIGGCRVAFMTEKDAKVRTIKKSSEKGQKIVLPLSYLLSI